MTATKAAFKDALDYKEAVRLQNLYEVGDDPLSTFEIKAMIDRTAEYADSNQFSSLGDLSRHM